MKRTKKMIERVLSVAIAALLAFYAVVLYSPTTAKAIGLNAYDGNVITNLFAPTNILFALETGVSVTGTAYDAIGCNGKGFIVAFLSGGEYSNDYTGALIVQVSSDNSTYVNYTNWDSTACAISITGKVGLGIGTSKTWPVYRDTTQRYFRVVVQGTNESRGVAAATLVMPKQYP